MTMKREPSISEQQAREIVERMGRRESRSEKSMDDFYRNIGLEPEHLAQPVKTITKKAETATVDEPSGMSASGLIETLARLHLETYREDIEQWRKL